MDIFPELLQVQGLTKIYPISGVSGAPRTVLKGVDFSLSNRDSITVVGPSGCGKSTLLLIIAGLLPATSGVIKLEKKVHLGPTHKIAMVLQTYGLFPWKTAIENILLGAKMRKIKVPAVDLDDLKRELGIEGLDHLYPNQLSGGQRQRVALGRALLLEPKLLLLDEPFAALDTITREHLQNHLLKIFLHRNFSFILVTHNIEEAVFLGRRIIVINPSTSGIETQLDNPGMGRRKYRETPEFFKRVLLLRQILRRVE